MALPPEVQEIVDRVRRKYPEATPDKLLGGPEPVPDGFMRLTPELIHAGKSPAGGWNRKQLAAIGIPWSDLGRRGWIGRNSGRLVRAEDYRRFLDLAGEAGRRR